MTTYAYLACPYSHQDPRVRQERYEASCRAAAWLMSTGKAVFSPISHSHPIEEIGRPRNPDHEFWMRQDRPLLQHAQELYVLTIDGWDKSKGVEEEMNIARSLNMPIKFLDPEWIV